MSKRQREIIIIDAILKFLWPVGIFRDASKGSQFERAAAYRQNREARGCLPHYMNNCLLAALALAGAGACLQDANILAASLLCWVLMTYSISTFAVLSAIYLGFTAWES